MVTATINLTPKLARAIADLAQRAGLSACSEVVIGHRLESIGEVCTISTRRPVAGLLLAEFERPVESADWTEWNGLTRQV